MLVDVDEFSKHNNDLSPNECLQSGNSIYSFCFEADGNIYIYKGEEPIWGKTIHDPEKFADPKTFVLDIEDGQLFAKDINDKTYWSTKASPLQNESAPFQAVLDIDGSFKVFTKDDEVSWDAKSTGKPMRNGGR